jgi:hypothetical protein
MRKIDETTKDVFKIAVSPRTWRWKERAFLLSLHSGSLQEVRTWSIIGRSLRVSTLYLFKSPLFLAQAYRGNGTWKSADAEISLSWRTWPWCFTRPHSRPMQRACPLTWTGAIQAHPSKSPLGIATSAISATATNKPANQSHIVSRCFVLHFSFPRSGPIGDRGGCIAQETAWLHWCCAHMEPRKSTLRIVGGNGRP